MGLRSQIINDLGLNPELVTKPLYTLNISISSYETSSSFHVEWKLSLREKSKYSVSASSTFSSALSNSELFIASLPTLGTCESNRVSGKSFSTSDTHPMFLSKRVILSLSSKLLSWGRKEYPLHVLCE